MSETELRITHELVTCRMAGDDEESRAKSARSIGGYAAVFNRVSQNLGGFVERIDPAFFNKSAGDGWPGVMARYNHDDNQLLGTSAAGTLRLKVDGVGLDYTVDTPRTREDVLELVQRGDVRQSSFAFTVFEDDWSQTPEGFPLRTLLSGRLIDVAPVNNPAYLDTSVGARSALDSLARKFDADPVEVRALAAKGELVSLFTTTDRTDSGAVYSARAGALAATLARL